MPCYNAMPYLPEALDSILNQTYSNIEILCINDGSSDETAKVLEKYAKKDNRIQVIHNETNLRLIATLNKGIQMAKGEYIARMDADDISSLNRIELQLQVLLSNENIDIVSTGAYFISESGEIVGKNLVRNTSKVGTIFSSFLYRPIGHAELLAKATVLKENPYASEANTLHAEDYELWTRLIRKGYILTNMSDFLYCVRLNSNSVSRKFTSIQNKNFWKSLKIHHEKFFNLELEDHIAKIIANRFYKPKLLNVKKGIRIINELKKEFIKNNKKNKSEIIYIYKTHIIDISYQLIKSGSFLVKLYSLYLVLVRVNLIFSKKCITYVFHKFNFSINTKK